ncbi:MAG TPA: DNA-processing protein DprA [Coriobacteriia bacterium]|jgi:DNA processing protein
MSKAFETHELRLGEEGYPAPLETAMRPPEVLYVAGDPGLLDYGLAVVGARRATPYGITCARRFAGWAAEQGVTIVSGAAHGCDNAAQQAAVDVGGTSIAVLGCGADLDYPPSSSKLLAHLRQHGAVISEVPWGRDPTRYAFPERNRLIAGLSRAVLIVEAALPSGTFSTARHAEDAGRDVWAVPGSVLAPECRGPNRLIAQGATPITDVSELSKALELVGLLAGDRPTPSMIVDTTDPVARALVADPMRPDDVARELDLDIVDVARRIARLESAGVLRRYRDGRYGPAERG